MSATQQVLDEVRVERERQDRKWGSQRTLPLAVWHTILSEEVGECAEASLENDRAGLREELVQVAAVAVATIEALDQETSSAAAEGPPEWLVVGGTIRNRHTGTLHTVQQVQGHRVFLVTPHGVIERNLREIRLNWEAAP